MDKILEKKRYVLITAARNEEKYIENTIKTIVGQTTLPVKWIIVSDGSTDRTDDIVARYSKRYNFIHLVRKTADTNRRVDFSSKVHAIQMGEEMLTGINYEFIGILDGDVTFDSLYYEKILNKFSNNSRLGIAGGIILDQYDDHHIRRSPDNSNYVSGCIQFFRHACYEEIGGLQPVKYGGEDTIAAITAQMRGWKVEAFEELSIFHHKHCKSSQSILKNAFREGQMFYALGSHPGIEILKSIKKAQDKPFILLAVARISGYFLSFLKKQERPVPPNFIRFLRNQQILKLKNKLTRR